VGDKSYIDTLANKIIKAASAPILFDGTVIHITCSVGISSYPQDSDSKEELLRLADLAMYQAKQQGKSGFTYSSQINFQTLQKKVKKSYKLKKLPDN